jgi:predicted RNA-binding Zn-ribbon protein involved in translation (DUF1610 family)
MYNQSEIIEAIMQGLPYPQHVSKIDLTSEPEVSVRFTWLQLSKISNGYLLESTDTKYFPTFESLLCKIATIMGEPLHLETEQSTPLCPNCGRKMVYACSYCETH